MEGTHYSSSRNKQDPDCVVDHDQHTSSTKPLNQNLAFFCDRKQEESHGEYSGRERLKRHRQEVAGKVLIPDTWGQEDLLKEWIDCSSFDKLLAPNRIASARKALVADGRRSSSPRLRIKSRS